MRRAVTSRRQALYVTYESKITGAGSRRALLKPVLRLDIPVCLGLVATWACSLPCEPLRAVAISQHPWRGAEAAGAGGQAGCNENQEARIGGEGCAVAW